MNVLAVASSVIGFCLLAARQDRHWQSMNAQKMLPRRLSERSLFQVAVGAEVFAGLLFLGTHGPGFGALLWGLALTASAMAVTFSLTWQPTIFKPLARALAAGSR